MRAGWRRKQRQNHIAAKSDHQPNHIWTKAAENHIFLKMHRGRSGQLHSVSVSIWIPLSPSSPPAQISVRPQFEASVVSVCSAISRLEAPTAISLATPHSGNWVAHTLCRWHPRHCVLPSVVQHWEFGWHILPATGPYSPPVWNFNQFQILAKFALKTQLRFTHAKCHQMKVL